MIRAENMEPGKIYKFRHYCGSTYIFLVLKKEVDERAFIRFVWLSGKDTGHVNSWYLRPAEYYEIEET